MAGRPSPRTTANIPRPKSSDSSTIPLRDLNPSTARASTESLDEKEGLRHRRSTDSAGSDFSLWSDTGDLGDQLADEEDPLRINLRGSIDEGGTSIPLKRRPKHVHYPPHDHLEHKTTNPGVDKEAIQIPTPPVRKIGLVEKILAIVMTGNSESILETMSDLSLQPDLGL